MLANECQQQCLPGGGNKMYSNKFKSHPLRNLQKQRQW